MKYAPHPYQTRAAEFIISHPYCGMFMDLGLGKTVTTLTAVKSLMEDYLEVRRVLVIAPKSVALNTWSGETAKWDHLASLRISVVMGTAAQRRKALASEADIWVTNRDNTVWLVGECLKAKDWPFDMVILDESTSFKNFQSKRWKALWRVRPLIGRMVLLTGTPTPNGLEDLWAQIKLLDRGERLGAYIGPYREKYFRPGARNGSVVYQYIPRRGAEKAITDAVGDICLSMRTEDYLTLPPVIDGGMLLELPEMPAYLRFQKDCIMQLEGTEIAAVTAVALTNKLLQFSSGAVYDDDHVWHAVSSAKLEALLDILEQTREPVLVFYNYRHEQERIMQACGAELFRGEPEILARWNRKEIPVMLCHPASVGYGLNLQQGGHVIVWFSPTWNLELYEQANARLHRQGQEKPVVIYHLVCRGTMDEVVMSALEGKTDTQVAIMEHLKRLMP